MIRQPHTAVREMIVAKAIEEVASELRMVRSRLSFAGGPSVVKPAR